MDGQTETLQFGVELELLVSGQKKSFASWRSLAQDVSKRLLKAGINNHVTEGKSGSAETYHEWSIVPEVTIPSQPGKNTWGIELVSPIYPAEWCWASDIETIYTTMRGAYKLIPSTHCSTHVHVSRTPTPLCATELSLLAKAVLYFEPALDGLVPPVRRSSSTYWCQSNRTSRAIKDCSLAQCFEVIGLAAETMSTRSVVETVNLFPAGSAYGRAHGKKQDFIRGKAFKWDFSGMLPTSAGGTGMGTVEFRQPPGCVAPEDTCVWITLVLAFVSGVIAPGTFDVVDIDNGATSVELWRVLQNGGMAMRWGSLGLLGQMFEESSSDSDK